MLNVLSNMNVKGTFSIDDASDFPANPKVGQFSIKQGALFVYQDLLGVKTWYPLTQPTVAFVHTQGLAALTWTVNHNLDTAHTWFQVQDTTGNIVSVEREQISVNQFILHFTEAIEGTCVVVAPETFQDAVGTGGDVASVNGKTGVVVLTSSDIGNLDDVISTIYGNISSIQGAANALATQVSSKAETSAIPTGTSQLTNDANFQTDAQVDARFTTLVGLAPANLDTLGEITTQLAADESATAAIVTGLALKADITYVDSKVAAGDNVVSKTFNGATAVNYATEGSYVAGNVTGAATLTITGVPNDGKAYGMTFELNNAGTNITWPASVTWLGTAPTLRASGVSMVTLVTRNGGTNWYGSAA